MRKKLIGLLTLGAFSAVLLIVALDVAQLQGQPGGGKKGGAAGGKKGGGQTDAFGNPVQPGAGGKGGKKGGGAAGFGGAGGGGFGQGGGFNLGTLSLDAGALFDQMSGGGDVVVIENSVMRQQLQQYAASIGETSGTLNRDQFSGYVQNMTANLSAGGLGALLGGKGKGGAKGKGGVDPNLRAEQLFRQYDVNGDDNLVPEEMPSNLRAVYKNYDLDGNGMLTLDEFKLYVQATMAAENQLLNNSKNGKGPGLDPDDLDYKATVYRYGKLPKELPMWFTQMDKDRDGQVGLYEWKDNPGKGILEFQLMDRNGDGLLTAEEVLWYIKKMGGGATGTLADATWANGINQPQPQIAYNLPGAGFGGKKGGGVGGVGGPGGAGKKGGGGGGPGGGPGGGKKGGGGAGGFGGGGAGGFGGAGGAGGFGQGGFDPSTYGGGAAIDPNAFGGGAGGGKKGGKGGKKGGG